MRKQFWTKTHKFINATARYKDLIYIAAQQNDLSDRDVNHSIFIGFYRGEWYQEQSKNWTCAGMCIAKKPTEKLISISENGEIWTYVSSTFTDEKIQAKLIRNLTSIKGIPFACGMNREVFKRIDENDWIPMHAPKPESNTHTLGFEAIDGFSENEIYSVGWKGEIWFYNGSIWKQLESPTSEILTSIVCAEDKYIYVAGRNGVILKGKGEKFKIISDKTLTDDFFDIAFFKNKIYLSSLFSLFTINNGEIETVNFGSDFPSTYGNLTKAEGVLWSVGLSDCFSFDGKDWKRIE